MYAKIQITGELEVVTGMHIGGSSTFSAIGAVDSPVIKDIRTNEPMIPGSSLKGKLRTLLAKNYNQGIVAKPNDDVERLTRLFGNSEKDNIKISRVLFSDMFLCNKDELSANGIDGMTEVKFENTINRLTAVANPRQIERAIRGTCYSLDILYEVCDDNEIEEDIEILVQGFKLLQYDYLGGHGSRGYGKVKFNDLTAEIVVGYVDESIIDICNNMLREV